MKLTITAQRLDTWNNGKLRIITLVNTVTCLGQGRVVQVVLFHFYILFINKIWLSDSAVACKQEEY
jgi:hypothetical protein